MTDETVAPVEPLPGETTAAPSAEPVASAPAAAVVDPAAAPVVEPIVEPPAAAPATPEPPAMTAVALLASDGTYLGIGPLVAVTEVGADQVAIPPDCDLAPGRYRWDSDKKTFVLMGKVAGTDRTPPPEALEAIAFGLLAQWKTGAVLHDKTLRWLDAWLTSIDKMKSIDGGGHLYAGDPLVVEYAMARGLLRGQQP